MLIKSVRVESDIDLALGSGALCVGAALLESCACCRRLGSDQIESGIV